jgi:hypothetical protein
LSHTAAGQVEISLAITLHLGRYSMPVGRYDAGVREDDAMAVAETIRQAAPEILELVRKILVDRCPMADQ